MHVPIRTCVACRRCAGKRELIRLVVARGTVQVDPSTSCPGRGAYVCGFAGCIDAALRRDGAAIRRALRLGHTLQSDHVRQADQGRVTLDVDVLRAQLGEEGDTQTERSDARRGNWRNGLVDQGNSPGPEARKGVSA
jgi:predicted RNA-binding protein YlxR (DUF448 family)